VLAALDLTEGGGGPRADEVPVVLEKKNEFDTKYSMILSPALASPFLLLAHALTAVTGPLWAVGPCILAPASVAPPGLLGLLGLAEMWSHDTRAFQFAAWL